MDNLIFIGLPGCGKVPLEHGGKSTGPAFYDADIVTERLAGEPFPTCLKKGKLIFGQGKQKRFVSFAKRIAASFLAAAVL